MEPSQHPHQTLISSDYKIRNTSVVVKLLLDVINYCILLLLWVPKDTGFEKKISLIFQDH